MKKATTAKQRAWRREFARRYGKKKHNSTRPRPVRRQPSRRTRTPSRPQVKRVAPNKRPNTRSNFISDAKRMYRYGAPRAKKTYHWAAPRAKRTMVRSGHFVEQQGKRMATAAKGYFQRRREKRREKERMVWRQ